MTDDDFEALYGPLFDRVRATFRELTAGETQGDGALDAIQFNARTAERELEELREAAQYHLEWGGVRNMDGGPKFPLCAEAQAAHERLSAALAKVRP